MSRPAGPARQVRGTRFRLYPQLPVLEAYREPETVWLSCPPGTITAGPADDRIYVADAVNKRGPYEYPYLPPYAGAVYPPALPDRDGHFDHPEVGSPEFRAVHMYGTVRLVLSIWEVYCGQPIPWHFRSRYPRLELVPYVEWENAHAGFGFLETGYGQDARGERFFHCLNFDVLAHEFGHLMLYSLVGTPVRGGTTSEFLGFHESAADTVALVSVLHFGRVLDHVLRQSQGNLYNLTELSRFGELSQTEQIRVADNALRMSDVPDATMPPAVLCQPGRHELAQPLTGAVFDILVDVFQQRLVDTGLISPELDHLSGRPSGIVVDHPGVGAMFAAAYRGRHEAFRSALAHARDYTGTWLARAWRRLSPDGFRYVDLGNALLAADWDLTGGRYYDTIRENLVWREIGVTQRRGQRAQWR